MKNEIQPEHIAENTSENIKINKIVLNIDKNWRIVIILRNWNRKMLFISVNS